MAECVITGVYAKLSCFLDNNNTFSPAILDQAVADINSANDLVDYQLKKSIHKASNYWKRDPTKR